jgi:hypothetical protein
VTRRGPLALQTVLAAALALSPHSAGAQAGAPPEDECTGLSSLDEELACLRAALAASRKSQRQSQPQPQVTPPSPRTAEIAAAPAPAATISAPAARLGEEQVVQQRGEAREAAPREVLAATLTDFRADRRGLLVMQLDNGQIWRQVENVGVPIRLSPGAVIGVEITPSGFGGYRMSFPELGRRIAVSRLE